MCTVQFGLLIRILFEPKMVFISCVSVCRQLPSRVGGGGVRGACRASTMVSYSFPRCGSGGLIAPNPSSGKVSQISLGFSMSVKLSNPSRPSQRPALHGDSISRPRPFASTRNLDPTAAALRILHREPPASRCVSGILRPAILPRFSHSRPRDAFISHPRLWPRVRDPSSPAHQCPCEKRKK